jgi:hypothetical protein
MRQRVTYCIAGSPTSSVKRAENADRDTYLFGEVVDGRNASTTAGVEEALGRAPRDFAAYARAAAATGALNPRLIKDRS